MNRDNFRRLVLPAIAVLWAAATAGAAVPLKDVTLERLRAWVILADKAGHDDPAQADLWKELDALAVVDPSEIVYESDKGAPLRIVWEVKPRRALDGEERLTVKKDLRRAFMHAVREHETGLVGADDAKALEDVSRFEVAPNPGAPVVVETSPAECERLRRELEETRAEVRRLRDELDMVRGRAGGTQARAARAASPRRRNASPSPRGSAARRMGGAAVVDDLLRLRQPLLDAGSAVGDLLPGRAGGAAADGVGAAGLQTAAAVAAAAARTAGEPGARRAAAAGAAAGDEAVRTFWVGYRALLAGRLRPGGWRPATRPSG